MNETKSEIIKLGDELIRQKGFNAFSYYDISRELGIKHAAIHYHFPKKCDLGIAIVKSYGDSFQSIVKSVDGKTPEQKLRAFLDIFSKPHAESTVCIMGALTPEINTLHESMQEEVTRQVNEILDWLIEVLAEGVKHGTMWYSESARTRALLILTSMMSSLSLTRITGTQDFSLLKNAILNEIIINK